MIIIRDNNDVDNGNVCFAHIMINDRDEEKCLVVISSNVSVSQPVIAPALTPTSGRQKIVATVRHVKLLLP